MLINDQKRLLTLSEFRQHEPAVAGSDWALRYKVREGYLRGCIVKFGHRYFVDMDRWEAVKASSLLEPTTP